MRGRAAPPHPRIYRVPPFPPGNARKGGREPVRNYLTTLFRYRSPRGLMRCRKVKMSTCQLAGNVLVFLALGNSAIREWQVIVT